MSNAGTIQWQRLLGGGNDDEAFTALQTSDGGYIVAGQSQSSNSGTLSGLTNNGGFDGWLIKLDAAGNLLWQKLYGGNGDEVINSIAQTPDGGYVVAGTSASTGGGTLSGVTTYSGTNGWVMKLDGAGNILWQQILGSSDTDVLTYVRLTGDGNMVLCGYTGSANNGTLTNVPLYGYYDYWFIKMSLSGNTLWQKRYGGSGDEQAAEVQQTADNGYVLVGTSSSSNSGTLTGQSSNGQSDCWIVKIDTGGNLQWQKLLGGVNFDYGRSIKQLPDGSYLMGGSAGSPNTGTLTGVAGNGGVDYWVVKLSATGGVQWQKLLGGSHLEDLRRILTTADGYFVLAGTSFSSNTGTLAGIVTNGLPDDGWVIKEPLTNATPLPVTVKQFAALCKDESSVVVTWETAQEINSNYFEIQKSVEGTTWRSAGQVIASGNSTVVRQYVFTDQRTGEVLYRLKQADKNGNYTYSAIAKISCERKQDVRLYPVPAKNSVTLRFSSEKEQRMFFEIIDNSGNVVCRQQKVVYKGDNQVLFNLSQRREGWYYLKGFGESAFLMKRFLVIP